MPNVNSVQRADVQAAIARASVRTGVDFDYLLAQAKLESGLNPSAKASTSSASGLYQFIDSTWLRTMDRHGAKHGMGWADNAISPGGRVSDPAARAQILSLRYDADTASLMAAELTRENAEGLRGTLGREPEPAELYLAHFMGLGGAQQFLGALANDPGQSAAALMPQAARANRSIFYSGGQPRSVGEVMQVMRDKVGAAYGDTPMPGAGFAPTPGGFSQLAAANGFGSNFGGNYGARYGGGQRAGGSGMVPSLPGLTRQASMSDTLRSTFGDSGGIGGKAGGNIAAAYGKFRAFGL